MTTIYTIVLNSLPIGFFADELHRDAAFVKYVEPKLAKEDSFLKGDIEV